MQWFLVFLVILNLNLCLAKTKCRKKVIVPCGLKRGGLYETHKKRGQHSSSYVPDGYCVRTVKNDCDSISSFSLEQLPVYVPQYAPVVATEPQFLSPSLSMNQCFMSSTHQVVYVRCISSGMRVSCKDWMNQDAFCYFSSSVIPVGVETHFTCQRFSYFNGLSATYSCLQSAINYYPPPVIRPQLYISTTIRPPAIITEMTTKPTTTISTPIKCYIQVSHSQKAAPAVLVACSDGEHNKNVPDCSCSEHNRHCKSVQCSSVPLIQQDYNYNFVCLDPVELNNHIFGYDCAFYDDTFMVLNNGGTDPSKDHKCKNDKDKHGNICGTQKPYEYEKENKNKIDNNDKEPPKSNKGDKKKHVPDKNEINEGPFKQEKNQETLENEKNKKPDETDLNKCPREPEQNKESFQQETDAGSTEQERNKESPEQEVVQETSKPEPNRESPEQEQDKKSPEQEQINESPEKEQNKEAPEQEQNRGPPAQQQNNESPETEIIKCSLK